MSRLAIIDHEKCKPKKCNHECQKKCPPQKMGKRTIDIEDVAIIYEEMCIGCGACVKACPFNAIMIVNIPKEIEKDLVYTAGKNAFRLYKLPKPQQGKIYGFLGNNGIGKSTLVRILTNKIDAENMKRVKQKVKGTELQKYLDLVENNKLKIVTKVQNVEKFATNRYSLKIVSDLIAIPNKRENYASILSELGIPQLERKTLKELSGGELQRVLCACVLIQKADVYVFDEPSNYLDVKQRLLVSKLIQELKDDERYIFVIEHDLTMLDYITDVISILYGTPAAFGVVSSLYSTAEAINVFFKGYLPKDNVKFRNTMYTFKDQLEIEYQDTIIPTHTGLFDYPDITVKKDSFELTVCASTLERGTHTVIILGENGTGKTTFLNELVKSCDFRVSYKTQYTDLSMFKKNGLFVTVRDYLNNFSMFYSEIFKTQVLNPLNLSSIYDKTIDNLSGGELQKLSIVICLIKDVDIYILDEPSASLDIETRAIITRVFKRYFLNNKKIGFIVEHDIMMCVSLGMEQGTELLVFENCSTDLLVKKCKANAIEPFNQGMNRFLKMMNVTFRTDTSTNRPRVNKLDSTKDKEQKQFDKYFI